MREEAKVEKEWRIVSEKDKEWKKRQALVEKKILEGLEAKERLVEAVDRAPEEVIPEISPNVEETLDDPKRCKEVLDDHVITCCSDYLFKSHGVEAAIAAKDRAVHAEVDARQGLGIR